MIKKRLLRLKDRDTRKVFGVVLGSKMLAILMVLGAVKGFAWYFDTGAGAAGLGQAAHKANDLINPIDTMWTLFAAFLVFFMQAGFMALEAGFARSRETVNIMMECVFDTCLCGILYFAFGFAFQFGAGNSLIGHQYFLLHGSEGVYPGTGVAFLAFFLFQFAFVDTASTITSGAMVGRTSFKGDILYSTLVSGFVYPIFGHWVWGPGGWLANGMGLFHGMTGSAVFRDFAGSTVVHTVGGFIALAGAVVLGPRLGRKFKRDGGGPTPPHDLIMASIGAVILWFGWYGFNPGSTLSGMDFEGIGRVAANTTLAACAGGLIAVFFVYPRSKTWDLGMSLNGFLGGLVAITAPCYWVSPVGAIAIGAAAGVIVPLGVDLLEHLRIDDPIGAVPVHGMAGIWGTLSVGLFANGHFGLPTPDGADLSTRITGVFYGGGFDQLKAQLAGSLTAVVVITIVAFTFMYLIRRIPGTWNLRVERDGELEGLDIFEHGLPAYHMEFGHGVGYSTPSGSGSGASLPFVTPKEDAPV